MVDNIVRRRVKPLGQEVWRKDSMWFRRAVAYRLLHAMIPPPISRRLPRILRDPLVHPDVVVPPGAVLPPGTALPPGTEFPPGWTPPDPPPPGVVIPPGTEFPPGWTPEDPPPPGVVIPPGTEFPPLWYPGDPLPGDVIDPPPLPPPGGPLPPPHIPPSPGGPLPVRPQPTVPGVTPIWEDEFNDASIDALWGQLAQTGGGFSESGTQVTIQSGATTVIPPSTYEPNWIYQAPLAGDFDVKAKFDSWTAAAADKQEAGLHCEVDSTHWCFIGAIRLPGTLLYACHRFPPSYYIVGIAHPGWPVYLRIYRTEGLFMTQYSTDGNSWIDLYPAPVQLDNTGNVKIGLRANDDGLGTFNALFDWIRNT